MTLPTHYTNIIKTLHQRFDTLEKHTMIDAQGKIENIRARREANTSKVTEFTANFLSTGIFMLQFGSETYEIEPKYAYQRGYTSLNLYARELAKELKRPFVRLYNNRLLIPKTKKLSILTTPFMFVAKKPDPSHYHSRYNMLAQEGGVIEIPSFKSLYCYDFRGNEGKEWRETFLSYIKEPECRRALGFTSEVTP
jgi:hypothetical protein